MTSDLAEALRLVEAERDENNRPIPPADRALVLAMVELVNVNRAMLAEMQRQRKQRRRSIFERKG